MAGHSKWSEVLRRKGGGERSPAQLREGRQLIERAEAAYAAGRRMVSHGERPLYRVLVAPDPSAGWILEVDELPGCTGQVTRRGDALATGRSLIALWLEVPDDSFDVELEDRDDG